MTGQTFWGIHAGKDGEANEIFLDKNEPRIVIGWNEAEDLSKIKPNREAFKDRVLKAYPKAKKGAVPVIAGVLFRFVHEIKEGDYVVYPSKRDKLVHVGKIENSYEYAPLMNSHYPNSRKVKWIKSVRRTELSQGALYEIGSFVTLFQVRNYIDEFVGILKGEVFSPNEDDDASVVDNMAENMEENTRDFILKKLSKEMKGHPLENFIAHLLNKIGYRTRISPEGPDGGIDIIAHKDELGIEPPIIKVQVKSIDKKVEPRDVQALSGNISSNEYGLFVALNGFSSKSIEFAKGKHNIRLIDENELVDIIIANYEKLDTKYKAKIPLKNIYIPSPPTDEE